MSSLSPINTYSSSPGPIRRDVDREMEKWRKDFVRVEGKEPSDELFKLERAKVLSKYSSPGSSKTDRCSNSILQSDFSNLTIEEGLRDALPNLSEKTWEFVADLTRLKVMLDTLEVLYTHRNSPDLCEDEYFRLIQTYWTEIREMEKKERPSLTTNVWETQLLKSLKARFAYRLAGGYGPNDWGVKTYLPYLEKYNEPSHPCKDILGNNTRRGLIVDLGPLHYEICYGKEFAIALLESARSEESVANAKLVQSRIEMRVNTIDEILKNRDRKVKDAVEALEPLIQLPHFKSAASTQKKILEAFIALIDKQLNRPASLMTSSTGLKSQLEKLSSLK